MRVVLASNLNCACMRVVDVDHFFSFLNGILKSFKALQKACLISINYCELVSERHILNHKWIHLYLLLLPSLSTLFADRWTFKRGPYFA